MPLDSWREHPGPRVGRRRHPDRFADCLPPSRAHFDFCDGASLEDLDSKNGTFLRGEPVSAAVAAQRRRRNPRRLGRAAVSDGVSVADGHVERIRTEPCQSGLQPSRPVLHDRDPGRFRFANRNTDEKPLPVRRHVIDRAPHAKPGRGLRADREQASGNAGFECRAPVDRHRHDRPVIGRHVKQGPAVTAPSRRGTAANRDPRLFARFPRPSSHTLPTRRTRWRRRRRGLNSARTWRPIRRIAWHMKDRGFRSPAIGNIHRSEPVCARVVDVGDPLAIARPVLWIERPRIRHEQLLFGGDPQGLRVEIRAPQTPFEDLRGRRDSFGT